MANTNTTETVTFEVEVDGRKANKDLAETEHNIDRLAKRTLDAAKNVEAFTAKNAVTLENFTRKTLTSAGAVDAYAAKTVSLTEGAKALQQQLGPAAAAISGVSAALGQNAGEAGKAVAAAGQLVAAFGAGGPLAVAITGMTIAVGALQKSWDDTIAAQDRAIASAFKATDDAIALQKKARDNLDAAKQGLRTAQGETPEEAIKREGAEQKKVDDANITAAKAAVEIEERKIASAKLAESYGGRAVDASSRDLELKQAALKNVVEAANKNKEALDTRLATLQAEKDSAGLNQFLADGLADYNAKLIEQNALWKSNYAEQKRLWMESDERRREVNSPTGLGDVLSGQTTNLISQAMQKGVQRPITMNTVGGVAQRGSGGVMVGSGTGLNAIDTSGSAAAVNEFNKEIEQSKVLSEDWSTAWVKAAGSVKESFGSTSDAIMAASSVAVAGTQQVVSDLITGQEHVAERFAVLVMGQAGQSLIGSGIKLLGEAAVSAFIPGAQGLAVAQGTTGLGLIAAGIGLGGTAAAIGHVAAGGTIGKALPESAAAKTSTGVNRGSGSSTSQGPSSLNVTVIYAGASGPTAEHGARAVASAMRRADRRGIVA